MKRKILSVLAVLVAVLMSTVVLAACEKAPAGLENGGGSGESMSTGQGGEPSASGSAAPKRRAGRERERRPKVAQRAFAAAGNRRHKAANRAERERRTEAASRARARAPPQSGEPGKLKEQQKRPPTGRLFSYPSSALGAGSGLKRREKLQIPLKPTRI